MMFFPYIYRAFGLKETTTIMTIINPKIPQSHTMEYISLTKPKTCHEQPSIEYVSWKPPITDDSSFQKIGEYE